MSNFTQGFLLSSFMWVALLLGLILSVIGDATYVSEQVCNEVKHYHPEVKLVSCEEGK